MQFLAFNTAGEAVEVALYRDGKTVVRRDSKFKKASAVCLPFVDSILNEAGLLVADMDFIGVCVGPGSFTGIRIGLAAARAFGQFANKPLVSVTACEVLAYDTPCTRAVTLHDAANGLVYAAVFEGFPRVAVTQPFVLKRDEVDAFLHSVQAPFAVCTDALCGSFWQDAVPSKTDGSSLVRAVLAQYETHGGTNYGLVVPKYVRKSQAEENLKP